MFSVQPQDLPAMKIAMAIGHKANKNILLVVGGGLGDQVCAEPTARYILEHFRGKIEVSLRSDNPELLSHLDFKAVYRTNEEVPQPNKFLVWHTYAQGQVANQFFNPNMMNSVDFSSISAIRGQLPLSYREINLCPRTPDNPEVLSLDGRVLLHVGKSWPSRTIPASWYTEVIEGLIGFDYPPVLIGNNCVDGFGFVKNCRDMREKLSLNDYIWLCQNAGVVITNDSSPLHVAAPGDAKIAFIPTVRNPDLLMHYRNGGQFGWEMKAFYSGKMWELFEDCPIDLKPNQVDQIPAGYTMEDFLPKAEEVVQWVAM